MGVSIFDESQELHLHVTIYIIMLSYLSSLIRLKLANATDEIKVMAFLTWAFNLISMREQEQL